MTTGERRRRWTVRGKTVVAVLGLAALGLVVAGLLTWTVQRQRVDARIDDQLVRAVDQVRRVATTAEGAGAAGSVSVLLEHAVRQTVPSPTEGTLALVDAVPVWYAPRTVAVRLEADAELVAALAALGPQDAARLRTVSTATATYRVATVPVRVAGDPADGMYVVATVRDAEMAAVAATWRPAVPVALGTLLAVGVAAWLVTGRLLGPLRRLGETAQAVGDDLTIRIPVTGDDDVTDLTRTVNDMLDRVEHAFAAQRRLLDDVGHELRTPLTVIGGHLELMDAEDPDDVAAARAVALDEIERMRRLVDDLLVLARAERPDFVRPAPTDVGLVTDETLDKARTLGDRRWRVAERAEAVCRVDAQRIAQAWLELATNAVKFSEPGSEVAIGSRVGGGRLRVWVSDAGRGIDPADRERVLGRFERAAGAGEPVDGSGLGLAIVAAIAAAHGGRVEVDSTPGVGTTVALDLPAGTGAGGATAPASGAAGAAGAAGAVGTVER